MVTRSPLGFARGLGSARSGTRDYKRQKTVSWLLIPLTIYAVGLMIALIGAPYEAAVATLGRPLIALPLFAFVVATALHMRLGMQQIIEDYVHGKNSKALWSFANALVSWGTGGVAGFALLKLALAGWGA